MSNPHFNKAVIIGVGLIGGSLAITLKQKGMAASIVGVGRGLANLEAAVSLGVIDSFTHDVEEAVAGADLVVVAVPVMKIGETIRRAAPYLSPGCVVTDVGSAKEAIIKEVEPLMPAGTHFVAGHPIAGTERSGVEAAFEGLFTGRKTILTPTANTDKGAPDTVRKMWEAAGAEVVMMDAVAHDNVLAAVSHLPHMIAYSLVNTVADIEDGGIDALSFSAGGFRDFTRIASSSPEMWADICAMNKAAILKMIDAFQWRLEVLRHHIETADMAGLKADFTRAKLVRDGLVRADGEVDGDE